MDESVVDSHAWLLDVQFWSRGRFGDVAGNLRVRKFQASMPASVGA